MKIRFFVVAFVVTLLTAFNSMAAAPKTTLGGSTATNDVSGANLAPRKHNDDPNPHVFTMWASAPPFENDGFFGTISHGTASLVAGTRLPERRFIVPQMLVDNGSTNSQRPVLHTYVKARDGYKVRMSRLSAGFSSSDVAEGPRGSLVQDVEFVGKRYTVLAWAKNNGQIITDAPSDQAVDEFVVSIFSKAYNVTEREVVIYLQSLQVFSITAELRWDGQAIHTTTLSTDGDGGSGTPVPFAIIHDGGVWKAVIDPSLPSGGVYRVESRSEVHVGGWAPQSTIRVGEEYPLPTGRLSAEFFRIVRP